MKSTHVLSLLTVLALSAIGCGGPSYERMEFSEISQGDLPASVSISTISMPIGAATKANIRPYDDDGDLMSGDVTSENPQVLEIAQGVGDHEYIFMGRTIGVTQVRYTAGGSTVAIARVEVTPQ